MNLINIFEAINDNLQLDQLNADLVDDAIKLINFNFKILSLIKV